MDLFGRYVVVGYGFDRRRGSLQLLRPEVVVAYSVDGSCQVGGAGSFFADFDGREDDRAVFSDERVDRRSDRNRERVCFAGRNGEGARIFRTSITRFFERRTNANISDVVAVDGGCACVTGWIPGRIVSGVPRCERKHKGFVRNCGHGIGVWCGGGAFVRFNNGHVERRRRIDASQHIRHIRCCVLSCCSPVTNNIRIGCGS